ncbi:MAG: response regulator transcription factor [Chloroflexi bacterium]|nr:response regulator transcription factor [Chloroflexota bacterium]
MPGQKNRLCLVAVREQSPELPAGLVRSGFICTEAADEDEALKQIAEQAPDLVVVAVNGRLEPGKRELIRTIKGGKSLLVVALVGQDSLPYLAGDLKAVDDFAIRPCGVDEVALRIRRLLQREGGDSGLIKRDNLVIDTVRCEVSVSGRVVEFTFREYELLRFLAANEGRVFTRDTLLDRVWGYDYYGGDRTVDVHIRRLRSKIEDAGHTFIETVRNIGYRFRSSDRRF